MLGSLLFTKPFHYRVEKWSNSDFCSELPDVIREKHRNEDIRRKYGSECITEDCENPRKSDDEEYRGIEGVSDNGWPESAHPEMFSFREFPYLHEDGRIREFSGEVGDEACEDDARSWSEDSVIWCLIGPFGIRRDAPDCPGDEREKKERSKSRPDDLSCFFDPIDLREDITEDIGKWEDDCPPVEGKRSDIDELHARDIGDDESGDEESRNDRKHGEF